MAVPAIKIRAAVSTYKKENPWVPSEAGYGCLEDLFLEMDFERTDITFNNSVIDWSFAGG